MIIEAEASLARAWRLGLIGRFQIEAAIQSAHAASRLHGRDTRNDIITLYERLIELGPSIGAVVGYAGALAMADRPKDALALLDDIDPKRIDRYQSYWAVRAHCFSMLNQTDDAVGAYRRAIGLCEDPATRAFLQERLAGVA
jgi:RNA polymerase sigma-70 factor (ECF subfamily)